MRALSCVALTAACASTRPAAFPDAEVIARSEALFRAVDGHDAAAFRAAIDPGFVLLDAGRTIDAARLAARFQTPRADAPRRVCTDARVRRVAGTVIYIAECTEHLAAHDDMPASQLDGANTLVWVAGPGGTWRAAYWQWNVGGVDAERGHWNAMYRSSRGFKRTANQHLIDSVRDVTPGTALDVAMGQGRNALYLAERGWTVTGVDISDEGIRLARDAAARRGLALDAQLQDVAHYDFGTARWDLVTLIYAGSDPALIAKIQRSIKPGGRIVVEFFHRDATKAIGIGGFAEGELAAQFATGWDILRDEVVVDVADWGLRETKLVRFTARKR